MSNLLIKLRSLNPLAAFFGPLFQKEVRTAGRRRSTYILRLLYCLGLLTILVLGFVAYKVQYSQRSAALNLQAMQQLAPAMTLIVGWFQFFVLFFASPVMAAGSICDERRARSLDVLMTTPMSAAQIVGGKLSSRIVQMVILSLLAAPGLLAVRVFGGLSAEVVGAVSAVSISTAILGSSLAVMFSLRQKRATLAALFAFLALLLLQCGPSLVEGIRFYTMNEWVVNSPFRQNILATCSPATLAMSSDAAFSGLGMPRTVLTFGPQPAPGSVVAGGPTLDLGPMWLVNSLYNLALSAVVAGYSTLVLRRAMKQASSREVLLAAGSAPTRRAKPADPDSAAPPETEEASERFAHRQRHVGDNPVLWREVRQPTFGSRRLFRVILVLTLAALAFLDLRTGLNEPSLHMALAFIACLAVMFQSVFLTSGPFAGEREARTWDVLLTTTLTPSQIIRGKLLGSLRGLWFIPAVVVAHFAIAALFGSVRPMAVFMVALILAGPALLLTTTGLMLSLRFRKAVTAGALNLGIAFGLWGLAWFAPLIVPAVLRALLWIPARFGLLNADLAIDNFLDNHYRNVIDGIFSLNPIALTDSIISPCLSEGHARTSVPFEGRLIFAKLNSTQALEVVLAVFAFHAVIAALALWLTRARFRAWSGRAS